MKGTLAAWASLLLAAAPEVVTVAPPDLVRVAAGGSADATLAVAIREGFKVQANPAADEFLVPLRLEVPGRAGLALGEVGYPEAARYRLRGASSDLLVYEGEVELRFALEAGRGAAPGPVSLQGRLHYQACDDRACRRPTWTAVLLEVLVEPEP